MVVDKEYRRFGLGTKLINKALEYARQKKIKKIDLYVTADNSSAVEFYKNKGFEIERYMMSIDVDDTSKKDDGNE